MSILTSKVWMRETYKPDDQLKGDWTKLYRIIDLHREANELLAIYERRDREDPNCWRRPYLDKVKILDSRSAELQRRMQQ